MMRRSSFWSQIRPMVNARSGFVYVFHRAEKKLGAPLGYFGPYGSTASALDAQSPSVSPSFVVCL